MDSRARVRAALDHREPDRVPRDMGAVIADAGRAVYVGSVCAGLTEMLFRLRGFEDGYMDLAADPALARELMERVLEMKLAW